MAIRTALTTDARELAFLGERLWRETYTGLIPESDLNAYVAEAFDPVRLAGDLADPNSTTLVLEDRGTFQGYAWLRAGGPEVEAASPRFGRPLEVARFYVDRSLHGTGAAPALMGAVLSHAAAAGHDGVWLQVWEQNPRAIRFYAKAGFTDAGATAFRVGNLVYRDRLLVAPLQERGVLDP
jgi:GNAT superfamily N-acetyltransferase